MAYYDANKKYGYGAVGDFLDAGMKKQGDTIADQQADLNVLVNDLAIGMQSKAGSITDDEAEKLRQEGIEQIESDLKENKSNVTKRSLLNMGINSAGIVLSGVSAGSMVKAGSVAASGASKALGSTAAASLTKKELIEKTGKMGVTEMAKKLAVQAGNEGGKVALKNIAQAVGYKAAGGIAGANLLVKAGAVALPAVATQVYTRTKTAEEVSRMQQTYNVLNSRYEYLQSEDAKLDETMQADTAEWQEYHQSGLAQIEAAYKSGQLTDEQYAQAYDQFIQDSDAKWEEYAQGHRETADYVTQTGVAYAEGEYALNHGYDLDRAMDGCTTVKQDQERNPEAKQAYDSGMETAKKLDTGSSFTNFLATMNATLLHYVPGLAYVEAAAIKSFDVVADFVASKLPIISYEEKHKGESISEMAKAICTDAEARYDLSHQSAGSSQALASGKAVPQQDAAEIAEQVAAQGQAGLEAAPC